jgi:predicted anti-sigma-YlaC factor YlaD
MNCNQVRELLPDLAAGMGPAAKDPATQDVQTHLGSCPACAAKLQGFRQTMALLDQWQTPDPGPYFDTRLGARLREEFARPAVGIFQILRRPVLVLGLAALLVAGTLAFINRDLLLGSKTEELAIVIPVPGVPAEPGTAVGDLQALEKNQELYADFDVLDELQIQDEVTANP